ncbi:MAG: mechanosensitive ion channel family protein [Eubacterium sp.]|nr:mechanosensitive ion channel family protein [Eubacterium sp.]
MYYDADKITIMTFDDLNNWIHGKGKSLIDFSFKLIIALILFYILCKVLKKLSNSIQTRLDKRGVDHIASGFVIRIIRYGIIILALFTIITQLHIVEAASIAALIASAGVGISLAMQGALSNFAGGVLLLVLKPFKKGDYIVIPSNNIEGTVEEIETYYTTIRTVLNEIVKIPNSQLTNNSVINRKGSENRALLVKVNVAYNSDIKKAKSVLKVILDSQMNTLGEGKNVFVEELGDHSVVLGVFCMVPVLEYNSVRRELNEKILTRFREEGIEIPYNQIDVHLVQKEKKNIFKKA